eukprot:IDg4007t1
MYDKEYLFRTVDYRCWKETFRAWTDSAEEDLRERRITFWKNHSSAKSKWRANSDVALTDAHCIPRVCVSPVLYAVCCASGSGSLSDVCVDARDAAVRLNAFCVTTRFVDARLRGLDLTNYFYNWSFRKCYTNVIGGDGGGNFHDDDDGSTKGSCSPKGRRGAVAQLTPADPIKWGYQGGKPHTKTFGQSRITGRIQGSAIGRVLIEKTAYI